MTRTTSVNRNSPPAPLRRNFLFWPALAIEVAAVWIGCVANRPRVLAAVLQRQVMRSLFGRSPTQVIAHIAVCAQALDHAAASFPPEAGVGHLVLHDAYLSTASFCRRLFGASDSSSSHSS